MEPVRLSGLRPQSYEHPSDKQALDLLTKASGLDLVVRKLNEWSFERLLRVELTGSYLRATVDSLPEIHKILMTACDRIDLPVIPDLYVAEGSINAFTSGVDQPIIVINSGAVDHLSKEELLFVIGHEAGHIKSGHVLYYQIAEIVPVLGEMIGAVTLDIGKLLSAGLQMALLRWKRTSELTADRAGLLACQDADAAFRALMKLAGLPHKYYGSANTEDFLAQARRFEAMDSDKLTLVAKVLSTLGASHPWTVSRAQQLLAWIDSGEYEAVLKGHSRPGGLPGRFCRRCGKPVPATGAFCGYCGTAVEPGALRARQ